MANDLLQVSTPQLRSYLTGNKTNMPEGESFITCKISKGESLVTSRKILRI